MAEPAAFTDPAVAAGLVAAIGAIGLTIRTRIVLNREPKTTQDRELWLTRAAGSLAEQALMATEDDERDLVIDLRLAHLRDSIDLRWSVAPSGEGEQAGEGEQSVEIDLSDESEPSIGLGVKFDPQQVESGEGS